MAPSAFNLRLTQQDAPPKPLRGTKPSPLEPAALTRVTLDLGSVVGIPSEAPPAQRSHSARAHPVRIRLPPASRSPGPAADRCLLLGAGPLGRRSDRRGSAHPAALAGLWAPDWGCEQRGGARAWKEEGGVGGLMMKKSPPSRLLN